MPYIAGIIMFGGNFAPRSWAFCDGQLLPIAQNTALFSIIGTIYGGDGRTTFALPDMRGRIPLHAGNGPGLSDRRLGSRGGVEDSIMTTLHMPSHNHAVIQQTAMTLRGSGDNGSTDEPSGAVYAIPNPSMNIYTTNFADENMGTSAIIQPQYTTGNTGNGQTYNNMMPYLAVNFIIALFGVFPSRS